MSEMIPKAAAQSELVAKLRALAETHSIGKCDHATHQDDGICGDCDDQAAATMREAADALLASASVSPQEEASAVPPTNTAAEIEAELAACQNIVQPCYYCLGLRKKLAALQAASVSRPAPTWRPMESAPKDRFVLLYQPGLVPDVGKWFDHSDGGWWVSHAIAWQPTHWKPANPPPSSPSPAETGEP